jgi:uroporphyrin-3 C-methyltransferase
MSMNELPPLPSDPHPLPGAAVSLSKPASEPDIEGAPASQSAAPQLKEPPSMPPSPPPSSSLPPSPPPSSPRPPSAPEEGYRELLQRPLSIVTIVLSALLITLAWSTHNQIQHMRLDVARSLQKVEASNNEAIATARSMVEQNNQLQSKVTVLENRQSEAQSQQIALEQLYQDLSKNRDEWALAEIEQVLSTASQQLQLAGNVQGALIALQNADRSLSRSDKPQFIMIRRAIAADMERLKALPGLDMAGVAVRIDSIIDQVETLPMLANEKPVAPSEIAKPGAPKTANAKPPNAVLAQVKSAWSGWTGEMWDEVRQLIRVRRVDTPAALMLAPSEAYFLRENLKLRLLNARLALLSRNETAFRNDLIGAQDAIAKYFDTRARSTQSVQALLRQVQANNLAIEMPTLADSLNAVRNYKAKP